MLLLLVESGLSVLALALAFAVPRLGDRWFSAIERRMSRFAAHRRLAVFTILFLALGVRIAVLPIEPIPAPGIHDEFGYLLSGDTFAHGRLTNPTHPMWMHFESMTIIQKPTYCSAFYPAQGAFLALGQVVLRHPFWGVWLSTGLMCAAICWALQGWMPPAWAFLGGLLAIMRVGIFSYWADSYWGGSVAAVGGALVLGSLPRIRRHCGVRDALLMGVGLAILANSRPYEGLFYSLPVLIVLAIWFFYAQRTAAEQRARTVAVALGASLAIAFLWMGYFFWRATGNPFRPPYLVDVATYFSDPPFLFQSVKAPPLYHDPVMQTFYQDWHVREFLKAKHSPLTAALKKLFYFWYFFVGPSFTVLFLVLGGILPPGTSLRQLGRKVLLLLAMFIATFIAMMFPVHLIPHYAAPLFGTVIALFLQGMRRVRLWDRHGRAKGRFFVRALAAIVVITFATTASEFVLGVPRSAVFPFEPGWANPARQLIVQALNQHIGGQLVFVHYRTAHDYHHEWVYNDADIDDSKIVWAREMSQAKNDELIRYFHDRTVWVLDADESPPKLQAIPSKESLAIK